MAKKPVSKKNTSAKPASANGDNVVRIKAGSSAPKKEKVAKALKESQGDVWVCNDKEIKTAVMLIKKTEKITASPNSALAVAGLAQALKYRRQFNGPVVCILTGR